MEQTTKPKKWIQRLGYLALNVQDLDRSVDFYERCINLTLTQREADRAFLRTQFEHHCLVLYQSDTSGLRHTAYETLSDEATVGLKELLEQQGVPLREAPELPGRIGLAFQFQDPDGRWVEIYRTQERMPGRVSQGPFKMLKLGHFNMQSENPEPTIEFFRSIGMRLSDKIAIGSWLRCNEDHHGLAILKGKPIFHHHAYDVGDWEQIKLVLDWMYKQGVPVEAGPLRHGPGNNINLYVKDPDGVRIEFYCELEQIYDDEDHVREFTSKFNIWLQQAAPEHFYE